MAATVRLDAVAVHAAVAYRTVHEHERVCAQSGISAAQWLSASLCDPAVYGFVAPVLLPQCWVQL